MTKLFGQVKKFVSSHRGWVAGLFAAIYPILTTLVFVCVFQFRKAFGIVTASTHIDFAIQIVMTVFPPIALFVYLSRPFGSGYVALSIFLSVVYVPLALWCSLMAYLIFSCSIFGSCEVP